MSPTHWLPLLPLELADFLFGAYLHRNPGGKIGRTANNLWRDELDSRDHVVLDVEVPEWLREIEPLDPGEALIRSKRSRGA